jgi:hypothetical protein
MNGLTWFDGLCGFTPVSFAGFNIWRKLYRHRSSLLAVFHNWCSSWCSLIMLQRHPRAHHFPALAPCSLSMPAFHGRVIMDENGRMAEHQRGWCASRLSVSQLPWATGVDCWVSSNNKRSRLRVVASILCSFFRGISLPSCFPNYDILYHASANYPFTDNSSF